MLAARVPREFIAAAAYYVAKDGCPFCRRVVEMDHFGARPRADAVEDHLVRDLMLELGAKVPAGPLVRESYYRDLCFERRRILRAQKPDPSITAVSRKRTGCLACLLPIEPGTDIAKITAGAWVHVACMNAEAP